MQYATRTNKEQHGNTDGADCAKHIDGSDCMKEFQYPKLQKDEAERDPSDGHAATSHQARQPVFHTMSGIHKCVFLALVKLGSN